MTKAQTTTVTGTVYLTGKGDVVASYLSTPPEHRPELYHFFVGKHDMSSCWTPLGTFTAEVTLQPADDLYKTAESTLLAAREELDQRYFETRQAINTQLANLLALEAPSHE